MYKKNLVIFFPSFEKGGVANVLRNLLKSQDSKRFSIHIISSRNLLSSIATKNKFNFYPVTRKINIPFFPPRFVSALNAMIVLITLLKKLNEKTVVHSMQSNVAAIIACIFKGINIVIRNSENPIYSTIHTENKFFGWIVFFLKFLFYNFADGIITNSKGSANSLKYFVFNNKKIHYIYNPYLKKINKKKFKKKNYIINIARLRKQKDQKTLLYAFKLFQEKKDKYKLLILGHGNLKNDLKLISKKLKISNKVIFMGWTKNTLIYLKNAKIFVLSSVYEGFGNVLVDAINYDVPCVSTDCPSGPNEILLNGKGGYLAKPKSPKSLSNQMLYCIDNYQESLLKNSKAKTKLNRFLISKNTKKYFKYIERFT